MTKKRKNNNKNVDNIDSLNNAKESAKTHAEEKEDCVALQNELREYKNKYLRALADLDNYRKKVLKEKKEWEEIAISRVLYKLLNIIDDFERALESMKNTESKDDIKKGIDLIHKNLLDLLKAEHVHPFDSEGQKFDPLYHEAILTMETEEYEDGTIVNEVSKGYKIKDSILRPAKVVVAKAPKTEDREENNDDEGSSSDDKNQKEESGNSENKAENNEENKKNLEEKEE